MYVCFFMCCIVICTTSPSDGDLSQLGKKATRIPRRHSNTLVTRDIAIEVPVHYDGTTSTQPIPCNSTNHAYESDNTKYINLHTNDDYHLHSRSYEAPVPLLENTLHSPFNDVVYNSPGSYARTLQNKAHSKI
uniref:Secreted protein n=1 Tax=Rhabditophanes sp. KR3021 TaxID=114890 RepID=A0AC35THN0_9BILA